MKEFFIGISSILSLILALLVQNSLLQATSGQAMNMAPFYIFWGGILS